MQCVVLQTFREREIRFCNFWNLKIIISTNLTFQKEDDTTAYDPSMKFLFYKND